MSAWNFPPTNWIWTKNPRPDDGQPQVVYFRKEIHLDCQPKASFLDQADGTVATPHGPIDVSWKLVDGQHQLEVKGPEQIEIIFDN